MTGLEKVTYCGLYCGLCSQKNRIPKQAGSLRDTMRREGYEYWGVELEGFEPFWKFLNRLVESESNCFCRNGICGAPFCGIRKCARAKGIDICVNCQEYPCKKILGLAKGYTMLLAEGKRMKEIGIDAWVKEQEERAKTGFAYVDIRCQPYDIPE